MNAEKLEKIAHILKTIAHPLRIGVVELLSREKQLSVNQICAYLNTEQSLTSHHLSNMKLKGVLGSSKEGKQVFYFLKVEEVVTVLNCLSKCDAQLNL